MNWISVLASKSYCVVSALRRLDPRDPAENGREKLSSDLTEKVRQESWIHLIDREAS